ncbi:MAG: leucine-rich repeat domain-containing protein [Ruminococcaceae bacterium]|nr:leucine-rich repeat domain-containing protein [Oscillospiraceae bacterium]
MNKKTYLIVATIVGIVLLLIAVIVGIWAFLKADADTCSHDYDNFILTGKPDYKTPAQATRTCQICGRIESLSVYAATGLEYETNDEGITSIINADGFSGKVLYISSVTKDGKKVTAIEDSVFSEKRFEALYIEDGIEYIANYAFADCPVLKQIELPASLSTYGDYTFAHCPKLDSITLAEGSAVIGADQFYECKALTNITLPDTITQIPTGAFLGCTALTSITLPKNLTAIGGYAFAGCHALSEVNFPDTLKELYPESFAGCTSLRSLILPSLTLLSHNTFLGCTGLQRVFLPGTIEKIEVNGSDGPFFSCSETLVLYTDAITQPTGWAKHFHNYNSAVSDEDGGELSDDAYFYLEVIYNCKLSDFPNN